MLLQVDLANHLGHWQFPGTVGFGSWLSECPWNAEGGACVLRLPGRSDGWAFADTIERAVHGWDRGASGIRVEILEGSDLSEGVRSALARRFGIPVEASPWQVREALSRVLAERPAVLVVNPAEEPIQRDLWQEVAALRDEMSKTDFGATMTWVLMDNALKRLDGRLSFDYTRGQPVFGVFETAASDDLARWNAYVHVRLAWEAGGDPAIAQDILDDILPKLRISDDATLETGLNTWSRKTLAYIREDDRRAFQDCLCVDRNSGGNLLAQGLLWRPPGSRSLAPTPWAARALLLSNSEHPSRWLLRASLVCLPLANEILSRCQELEHQIKSRAVVDTKLRFQEPPEEIMRLWRRYCAGRDETTVYPDGHPAPPIAMNDAWFFASLGTFLRDSCSPLGRPHTASEQRVARLRNTLAHGHYVAWSHVQHLQRILDA